MSTASYQKLIVWQKSMMLAKNVYLLCEKLPKDETYGISSQMKRCAVSIPSNIAEGHGRKNTKEYIQFLHIAYGSSCELETQLILTSDIFKSDNIKEIEGLIEVQKMLYAMFTKLKSK
jgi:four helix bundle protein